MRKILVTSALPYANGDIHLGHLVETIQTDIWVRFQKTRGHECYYVCADDTHGTPIMIRAEKENITPEQLIAQVWERHFDDFSRFHIGFDHFYSTNSDENWLLSQHIYRVLRENNLINVRPVEQYFDPVKEMFLPDRFIKGECPKCHAHDQYGDSCEVCGTTYQPTDLINPYSTISGAVPIRKVSEHYFFKLSECQAFLANWVDEGHLQPEAANKMHEWIEHGLQDWDISRDAPYFGFEIPDAPGKYFYVWLDAPIGYMASFMKLCEQLGLDFNAFWQQDSQAELYHFIGKDILYFHALFWTATLKFSGYRTPNQIFTHGFLTVNGQKMSKSRGTFITAHSFANHINTECLRYYFAAKLSNKIEDIDLSFDDLVARVNSDLIGKFINIASRSAGFIKKFFENKLSAILPENQTVLTHLIAAENDVASHYENREYHRVIREIMHLADSVNQFVDEVKPWELAKQPERHTELHQFCTLVLNCFKVLSLYLKPVLPHLVSQVETFLQIEPLTWTDVNRVLLDHTILPYTHLMTRIDPKQIEALIQANQQNVA